MRRTFALALAAGLAMAALPGTAAAQDALAKLSIHGYLTQAYGRSDGFQILGISEDGTSDYRTAALQVRYDMDEQDAFVLQLSHERVGDSPFFQRDDVEMDWVFYQRRFSDATWVKAGRVPLPVGIYNELRDVGTLLPFYRPPDDVYRETTFAPEAVDGIVFSHRFGGAAGWALEVEPYAGQWKLFDAAGAPQQARQALGVHVWLSTPIEGLRFGAGARRHDQVQGGQVLDEMSQVSAALDARVGRFTVQAEYVDHAWENPARAMRVLRTGSALAGGKTYYGLVGMKATDRLSVHAQASFTEVELETRTGATVPFDDYNEDVALGAGWAFRPDLVLKVEVHENVGRTAEGVPGSVVFAPQPPETEYGLVSLSVSF